MARSQGLRICARQALCYILSKHNGIEDMDGLFNKQNIFACLPVDVGREHFETLLECADFKLERIFSYGQAATEGEWYDQDHGEWVLLLKGSAGLLIEGEEEVRELMPGDYLYLPAHRRHRVEWTQPEGETIWLALHGRG
jgi:cupin 2 domain-containing protein